MQGNLNLPPGKIHLKTKLHQFTVLLLLLSPMLYAQEAQFSLYQTNPLSINSANTGVFDGNWRLAVNYRNQWLGTSDAFRTSSVSFDSKVHILKQPLGVGLYFLNDDLGIGGISYNKIYGSLAYRMEIADNHFSIGLQPGYVFADFNSWYNWNDLTGDWTLPNGEANFGESVRYFDFNAGLNWRRKMGKVEAATGISFLHLNKPNISFFGGDHHESILGILDVNAKIDLNEKIYLHPSILLFVQSGITLTSVGTELGYALAGTNKVKNVFLGTSIRNGILDELSTLSVFAGLRVKRVDLAINYDMNLGNYRNAAGTMGAFEIALIYRSISTLLNSYSIPCERY